MESAMFSREEVAAISEGKTRPDDELVKKTRAIMLQTGAAPEHFSRVFAAVANANPDVYREYLRNAGGNHAA